ncbi:uncharacterized protein MKK02DRAFT_41983 [Dioszegia hungarica]|uniref:Late embryogenesis abundant protein LEA-2 subgroup domain-containing protein n=1 Tax=Dioszegia hungarica TaxID=4972 RepID=A0AA38LXQ4_9TREE|nr:uncharacterized protein MKK02DRAFT_41983 [Dioszegia hungarica]KAI9638953.1 hypothetical protein MKK02DRAFT_41983 [Dioszegia hungarica]
MWSQSAHGGGVPSSSAQYDDPYNQNQHVDAPHYQNAYNNTVPYQTHHLDPSTDTGFQANPSAEKITDGYPQNTERERKGRAGLNQTKSWAEVGPPPRSTGILRMWRKDERGKQWSRGGGVRTFFRFCCCCTTLSVIIIVSMLLAIALYVRPPNLSLNSINLGTSGVNLNSNSFSVNINLDISVSNPNWFNVDFKEISADVKYPGVDSKFGGGTLYNVNFAGYAESGFSFPLALNYSSSIDPNQVILQDLISKCGSATSQDVTVQYVLYLKLRILSFVIPVTTNSDASFPCPISAADIRKLAGGA